MKALLRHIFCWANKNEMSFGINKCATMVIKALNFVSYPGYEEPTFRLGIYSIHKASVYIYLINHIPSMPRYSWSKKSLVLYKKIKKKNITKFKDVIESYWSDVGKFQRIKSTNYDNFKFINTRNLFKLNFEYPHLSLGFNRILRLRAGYKYNTTIAIRSGRVSDDCPKFCPCCGKGDQSFI